MPLLRSHDERKKQMRALTVSETSRWAQVCATEELNDALDELRLERVESRDGRLYGKDKMRRAMFNTGSFSVSRTDPTSGRGNTT